MKVRIAPNATEENFAIKVPESTNELPVKEGDKIKAVYKAKKHYKAKVNQIDKSKGGDNNSNTVQHKHTWDLLKEQTNTFSQFIAKWDKKDIIPDKDSRDHDLYKPRNSKLRVEGDYFVLNYDYGPEGLESKYLENFDVRMRISDFNNKIIEHQVTGNNLSLKTPGSRGKIDGKIKK